jgi:hypothetical protein
VASPTARRLWPAMLPPYARASPLASPPSPLSKRQLLFSAVPRVLLSSSTITAASTSPPPRSLHLQRSRPAPTRTALTCSQLFSQMRSLAWIFWCARGGRRPARQKPSCPLLVDARKCAAAGLTLVLPSARDTKLTQRCVLPPGTRRNPHLTGMPRPREPHVHTRGEVATTTVGIGRGPLLAKR